MSSVAGFSEAAERFSLSVFFFIIYIRRFLKIKIRGILRKAVTESISDCREHYLQVSRLVLANYSFTNLFA